ncbi:SpaA isopeptide-forming pilin-related protein [Blautia sp. HCP28S3_G10]|uniref:SpaA isopeptide-forming pilin-related protein n=1 Tax=Blautia sp. HCP28S3_G10 TaxID=3438908 RepID=UPI003F8B66D4
MKKYFKKISALLMAAIMVLSMCTAVFAATGDVPSEDDSAQVTINGLEAGVTIKAYQVVDGVYKPGNGFIGFDWTDLAKKSGKKDAPLFVEKDGTDILNISQTDLTDIVSYINKNNIAADETFKVEDNKELTVGTWLLLVSGGTKVYNPMIVSVYYATEDGTVTGGLLNASDKKWDLVGGVAYAKETDITIDKVANKDTAAHGEDVNFTITGVIPSYSSQYTTDVTYKITDTLTNLELKGTPVVKLAETEISGTDKYSFEKTETGFNIIFKSAYIKGLADLTDAERTVTVTYTATVTAAATTWNPAKNEAKVDYTNNPDGSTTYKETKTNTYTFDINGQFLKVDETGEKPLAGAKFTLYKDYDKTTKTVRNPIKTDVTTKGDATRGDGLIIFKGLAAGTYYLTETEAPASYTLNTTVYRITITPTYESDAAETGKKVLKSYKITIDELDKDGNIVKTTDIGDYTKEVTTINKRVEIQNTKVGQLPSTGGMGTYIFTIAGVVLMACAAGAFIISRKKSSEE